MDKAPTSGFCPHCKTALNPGASACTGCGAFETTAWEQLGAWRTSVTLAAFVLSLPVGILVAMIISPLAGLVVWIGSMVGYFIYRSRSKRRVVWAVGGRRII